MMSAIAAVTTLFWLDARREANASLDDLEIEQTVVASSLAASLGAHLTALHLEAVVLGACEHMRRDDGFAFAAIGECSAPPPVAADPSRVPIGVDLADGRRMDLAVKPRDLLDGGQGNEPAEGVTAFLAVPGDDRFLALDGRRLTSAPVRDAFDRRAPSVRLGRPDAAQLGLPERTAMAGLAYVDAGPLGRWGVVTVASAARERDREKRAQARLVLGVVLASGLVLAFGTSALRRQRDELELKRDLDLAEAQHDGDEKLARAERLATMGTFAAGIVHEVCTPLGVIVGRAEQLAARVKEDERGARSAQIIIDQVSRIQHVVRRFLDMARGGPPSFELADPSDVARAAVAMVEHRLVKAGVLLKQDVPPTMPSVRCDRALLEHALSNLLLNACDACRAGGQVNIAARADSEQVAFVVIDDGAGISSEDAARVTEPLFTSTAEGGTGIGLAIVTEIAKTHRGALTIAPNSPRGTRACIEIPIAHA
jgi:signal transduction histidine kinase